MQRGTSSSSISVDSPLVRRAPFSSNSRQATSSTLGVSEPPDLEDSEQVSRIDRLADRLSQLSHIGTSPKRVERFNTVCVILFDLLESEEGILRNF